MQVSNDTRLNADDGLLLVGHGTRDPIGVAEFLETAADVAALVDPRPVEPCFLELNSPTIDVAVARLARRGVRRLTVMPLLLFAADHAKQDIPAAVAAAMANHAPMSIAQAPVLGCHPALVRLSALRCAETIAAAGRVPAESTLLLLVGRGSHDPSATAEMFRFAELRAEQEPVGRVETCFFAMAEPSFADILSRTATFDVRRVVVQPHLLFHGQLLAEIQRQVASMAAAHGDRQWLVSRHLGPHPAIPRIVADIAGSADAQPI